MMKGLLLSYNPPWHLVGDPDSISFAFGYGLVALTTIWMLERISQLLLFSVTTNNGILSDSGAHIAFNNCSWFDICRWVRRRPEKNCRLCRRALTAIALRVIIICADLLIVFFAVPREVAVYENEVGSTVLEFKQHRYVGPKTSLDMWKQTCRPDPIRFDGFKATAMRQICLLTLTHLNDTVGKEEVEFFSEEGDIRIEQYGVQRISYNIALTMRLAISPNRTALAYDTKPLPNIGYRAAQVFLNEMHTFRNATHRCKLVTETKASCSGEPLGQLPAQIIFEAVMTKKVNASKTLWVNGVPRHTNATLPWRDYPTVGFISRPRLCIYPAIFLAFFVALVTCLLKGWFGSAQVAIKQWQVLARHVNSFNFSNPLYLEVPATDHAYLRDMSDLPMRSSYSTILAREIRAAVRNGHVSPMVEPPVRLMVSNGYFEPGHVS